MSAVSPDLDLIRRFAAGDLAAFEQIVVAHQGRIATLCRYMLGDATEAEDATQDVFVKAFKGLKDFRPEAALGTWLYRIAVNTCIDRRRRPLFRWLFIDDDDAGGGVGAVPSDAPSPERLAESREASLEIQGALSRLSPKLRAAIVLKEIEGLSYEQIAETLEISLGTVKSRISRAREELKRSLTGRREQNRPPLVQ
jgi:RNA polymerase sigma-70 factor (ECF subfamily)